MTDRVCAIARRWIGTPYIHQASSEGSGTDCLGLIRGIWREVYGAEPELPPAYSPDWGEIGGQEVLLAAAMRHLVPVAAAEAWQPGQVVLFRMRRGAVAKHLGILTRRAGALCFVHAYEGHGVTESPLSDPWRRRVAARFRFPQI